ncbi:MAG TPA: FAD-dependent oxidoreductase [Terriglobales bacterium]|nr:FAD-dependent oxidoreductase [Terriglobales bacterium]
MFDLAIIGAGIVGAAAAYLAKRERPEWHVLLLDRSLVGGGATAHSAGLDFPYGRTPGQKHLSVQSARLYEQLRRDIPSLPIRRLPFLGIVSKKNAQQVAERFIEPVRFASDQERADIARSEPGVRVARDQELLVGCFGAIGYAQATASLLVSQFRHLPQAQCWEGVAISDICSVGDGHELKALDGRSIHARRVLIATGPWLLNGPGSALSKAMNVRTKKVAALHVLQAPLLNSPIIYFFDEDAFLLPSCERGEWIFSFTSSEWNCLPHLSDLYIRPDERRAALAILERYCPPLVPYCNAGRVFCDAYSSDWAPLITSHPGAENFVIAGACSGAGFRLVPAIAATALQLFPDFGACSVEARIA